MLVDWEADHSVSIILSSELRHRGANIVQKWLDGTYHEVILKEKGKLTYDQSVLETEREKREKRKVTCL